MKTYLALTDSQVQELQNIRSQVRSSASTLRQQIAEKQRSLNEAVAAGSSSAAELGQYLLDIQSLRKQISDAEAGVQAQAVAVLTADQKAKLQTLVDAAALQRNIRQAEALGLIAPLSGAPGPGPRATPGPPPAGPMGAGRGRSGGPMRMPRR